MKKVYIFLLLGFLSIKCHSQESNCEKFKTGKFLYTSEGLPDTFITRTETTQIETIKESKDEIQGKIIWKSNCNYEFTFTKCPRPYFLGKTIAVEIFEINGNTSKGKALFEGMTLDFKIEKLN